MTPEDWYKRHDRADGLEIERDELKKQLEVMLAVLVRIKDESSYEGSPVKQLRYIHGVAKETVELITKERKRW